MTPTDAGRDLKVLKSHAAFALQPAALMRLITLACLLCLPLAARAQTPTPTPTPTGGSPGTCTGMIAGSVGLAVPNGSGNFATIQAAAVQSVFGNAECACSPMDPNQQISLEIKLTTALGIGTGGSAEVWVGSGCDNYTTRTQAGQQVCEKISTPSIQTFTTAGSANNAIEIPIPGNAIVSPVKHDCSATTNPTGSNRVFLFLFNDPSMPFATCTLQLNEQNQGPVAATNPGASSGDGAITVNWTPPSPGSYTPSYFQVLCSDDCGNPVVASPTSQPIYSTCINGVLARRQINTGGATPSATDDGGVVGTDDLGGASAPLSSGSLQTEAAPFACDADAGAGSSADGGVFGGGSAGPLTSLDPRYICSGQLTATASSTRITGLTNYQRYHFVVVAVDQFGNAVASPVVDGTPQPTEDLWRRYRDAGGSASGCFIATAAFGSYENRWVWVLRDFRDEVLLPRDWGHRFVDWYYAHSPSAASWIAGRGWARAGTRLALMPVIAGAWFYLYVPPWQKALLLTLLVAFLLRKRIQAALRRGTAA